MTSSVAVHEPAIRIKSSRPSSVSSEPEHSTQKKPKIWKSKNFYTNLRLKDVGMEFFYRQNFDRSFGPLEDHVVLNVKKCMVA